MLPLQQPVTNIQPALPHQIAATPAQEFNMGVRIDASIRCMRCFRALTMCPPLGHRECQQCYPSEPPSRSVYYRMIISNRGPQTFMLVRMDLNTGKSVYMHDFIE